MRPLTLNEIISRVNDYSLEIEYIDRSYLSPKLTQFWNFINSENISKRILERIEEDFCELSKIIFTFNPLEFRKHSRNIIESLDTYEKQGAFGYFFLKEFFQNERKYPNSELDFTDRWFGNKGKYDESQNSFNVNVFKPFIKLFNFYLTESVSYNSQDYFSEKEVELFTEKLDSAFITLQNGQEVLFNEIQELKEQLSNLKKKNWAELLKGKLVDLALSEIISKETANFIIHSIFGEDIKFLN